MRRAGVGSSATRPAATMCLGGGCVFGRRVDPPCCGSCCCAPRQGLRSPRLQVCRQQFAVTPFHSGGCGVSLPVVAHAHTRSARTVDCVAALLGRCEYSSVHSFFHSAAAAMASSPVLRAPFWSPRLPQSSRRSSQLGARLSGQRERHGWMGGLGGATVALGHGMESCALGKASQRTAGGALA